MEMASPSRIQDGMKVLAQKDRKNEFNVLQKQFTESFNQNFISNEDEFPSLSKVSDTNQKFSKDLMNYSKTCYTYSDKLKASGHQNKLLNKQPQLISRENTQHVCNDFVSDESKKKNCVRKNEMLGNRYMYVKEYNSGNIVQNHQFKMSGDSSHSMVKTAYKNSESSEHNMPLRCAFNKISKQKNNSQSNSPNEKVVTKGKDLTAEETDTDVCSKSKKKKKRKSKVKRQVAQQTGKITVLTPEAHSKILNQSRSQNSQPCNNIVANINDSEEYPELTQSFMGKANKERIFKKNELSQKVAEVSKPVQTDQITEEVVNDHMSPEPVLESTQESTQNSLSPEKPVKNEKENSKVHVKDPITVSFFDILLTSKPKTKKPKEKENLAVCTSPPKPKSKKGVSLPHNLLDSSSPAIKRGKEREIPKAKKPSHLKRIILLDRKTRKEQVYQLEQCLQHNLEVKEDIGICPESFEACQNKLMENAILYDENMDDAVQSSLLMSNNPSLYKASERRVIKIEENKDVTESKCSDHSIAVISSFDLSNDQNVCGYNDVLEKNILQLEVDNVDQNPKLNTYNIDQKNLPPGRNFEIDENCSQNMKKAMCLVEIPHIDSFDSTEILSQNDSKEFHSGLEKSSMEQSKLAVPTANTQVHICEKEKIQAAKIVLHTRNFREYCTHLISKDIDDTVFALLDDLARFQDRMHQKDPVKARMKRRLVHGLKEVKKHVKMRKLKCIIIATDIENVQTEGGLNDALNDIKQSAADHHIPYVFALNRKSLGKVCHKPVPISCVGVFNYEGSEVNFKMMIELLDQSTKDYTEVLNNLASKLSDDAIKRLFIARMEAPETLYDIRTEILREFLVPVKK